MADGSGDAGIVATTEFFVLMLTVILHACVEKIDQWTRCTLVAETTGVEGISICCQV
jgi:hypothetical protein